MVLCTMDLCDGVVMVLVLSNQRHRLDLPSAPVGNGGLQVSLP